MDQEKQSLLGLNQETNQIIQELLQIFQRVQKNFDLMKKTIDVNKEIVEIIQKTGKKGILLKKSLNKSSPGQQNSMKSTTHYLLTPSHSRPEAIASKIFSVN